VNVTVKNPAQEAVRRYIAEELARERNAWIGYVMLSADLRDWCKSKGHEEVLDWRRRDIIEGLNKEEIRIRGKRIPDPETLEVIMRTGAYGWRFTDDKKPAFSKAPSKGDKDDTPVEQ
jgi:hypothetical protein